jgi:hypothetical protein
MGIKIDGYSWNNLEKVISIICLDFTNDREEIELLNKAAINKAGDRVRRFIEKVGDRKFYESLALTDPGRLAFDEVAEVLEEVLKFRVVLLSDKVLSSRIKKIKMNCAKLQGKRTRALRVSPIPKGLLQWEIEA